MNYNEKLEALKNALSSYGEGEAVINGFKVEIEYDSWPANPYDNEDMLGDWYQERHWNLSLSRNMDTLPGSADSVDALEYVASCYRIYPSDKMHHGYYYGDVTENEYCAYLQRQLDRAGIIVHEFSVSSDRDAIDGLIALTPETIREEFGVKRITKKVRQRAIDCLKAELETMQAWASGDVYGFTVTHAETGESVGSCWGFYGDNKDSGIFDTIAEFIPENEQEWYEKTYLGEFAGLVGNA